jgi:hypothetical protein
MEDGGAWSEELPRERERERERDAMWTAKGKKKETGRKREDDNLGNREHARYTRYLPGATRSVSRIVVWGNEVAENRGGAKGRMRAHGEGAGGC